jgi:DNA repair protein RadC
MNTKLTIKEDRPTYRLNSSGPRALSTAELLTIICGFTDISKAAELLSQAGSLQQLVRLTPQELQEFKDVGPTTAARILAAAELGRRVIAQNPRPKIDSVTAANNFLAAHFAGMTQEQLVVLSLDTKNNILRTDAVYTGSVNQIVLRPAEIFAPAIRCNAPAIIIAHNHPSGETTASPDDIHATKTIIEAGKLLSIELLDHIIVGHDCLSLRQTTDCWS